MASSTVEDYTKAIYSLQRDSESGEAGVARLAGALGVTNGTVTAMVHKLRDAGLAEGERYGGVRLTSRGERLALDVIRRHRLVEVLLVEVLGLDWSEVHEEAERLEHAMSAKLIDRLDAFLGRPRFDPHGDPIPGADGTIPDAGDASLAELGAGEEGVVARVGDQDARFLEFAARHGLRPGAGVRVVSSEPAGETMIVRSEGAGEVALSMHAAGKISVRRGGSEGGGR